MAVLDIDFHHGNGTHDIFYDRDDMLFCSLHGDPEDAFPHFLGYADETDGYAYEYNDLWGDPTFGRYKGPHIDGRAQVRRISIANSDASAYAYIDGAIDAADRAFTEQL